ANETNLSPAIVDNLRRTIARGKQVYAWAQQHRVPIALGTDLWGPEAQKSQLREFEIRIELDTAPNVIRSATAINAELLMQKGKLGTISPAPYPNLLVLAATP